MADIRLRLLGTFHAMDRGREVQAFRSDSERALLVFLAMNQGRPHSRESLAHLLWPEVDESRARNNLRVTLHRLRKALTGGGSGANWLRSDNEALTIEIGVVSTDAGAFETAIDALEELPLTGPQAAQRYQAVAETYGGDFLQGFHLADGTPFSVWAGQLRERLHRRAMALFWKLADYHLRLGELEPALTHVQRQLELEPWREEAHRQLMRLLALRGERTAALAQYDNCRRALEQELGVEPSLETDRLRAGIEAMYVAPPPNLPVPATPFIGRQPELSQLADLLLDSQARLISLVGPGGSGKSRLALELARTHRMAFLHGVYWVNLAPVEEPEGIPAAISAALHISPTSQSDLSATVRDYLAEKEMLLIFDNFEHLSEGTHLLDLLLESAPNLRLLVTSRAVLRSAHASVFKVEGLAVEVTNGQPPDACLLFETVARRSHPVFRLDLSNLDDVLRLCSSLGGLPLAIEMAASMLDIMTPAEIAAAVSHSSLGLRRRVEVRERHASMSDVFTSSCHLLSEPARLVLSRLTIFAGPFDRRAAEAVAGASPEHLRNLVDRSLIRRLEADERSARFDFHPLVKDFARAELLPADLEVVSARHMEYFHGFLAEQSRELNTLREPQAMRAVRQCLSDVRRAIQTAADRGQVAIFAPLMLFLVKFFDFLGDFRGGKKLFETIAESLQRSGAEECGFALALMCLAWHKMRLGCVGEAQSLLERSLELAGRGENHSAMVLTHAPNALGLIALHYEGDALQAKKWISKSLEAAERHDDYWAGASFSCNLARVALEQGDMDDAEALGRQALATFQEVGGLWGEANALGLLGEVALVAGEHNKAEQLITQMLTIRRRIGHRWGVVKALFQLGELALQSREYETATDLLGEALSLARDFGEVRQVALASVSLARAYLGLGKARSARRLLRGALREAVGSSSGPTLVSALALMARIMAAEGDHENSKVIVAAIDTRSLSEDGRAEVEELRLRLGLPEAAPGSARGVNDLSTLARQFLRYA